MIAPVSDAGRAAGRPFHLPTLKTEVPRGWNWRRLDALCSGIFDCPHSTPVLTNSGPYLARSQDIRSGIFRLEAVARVSETTYRERIVRAEPRDGDLLFSREGTYFGIAAEVPPGIQVCLGQRMVLIRPNAREAAPKWLRYWLNSPLLARHVWGFRDGTVAERLNLPTIRALPVLAPQLHEQQGIGRLLGSLDDRIELNRRMNRTLEAMAQALFRSWFVDFDPVAAKADGRQPVGLALEIAALFPTGFADSSVGPIPDGWEVSRIDFIGRNRREILEPETIVPGTRYIGLEHMPRGSIVLDEWARKTGLKSAKSVFRHGDVLFGKLRPYFHKVGSALCSGVCSTDILVVEPRDEAWQSLLLGHLSSKEFVDYADGASGGTRMPRINWDDMARFSIVLPPKALADALSKATRAALDLIAANVEHNRTLAALRDTLLPKLLAGEIRVREAEKLVGPAGA